MKSILLSALVCAFCLTANAKATKVCFWYDGNNGGSKGDRFTADVSKDSLTVSKVVGQSAWEGKFDASGSTVDGKDGHTYIDYNTNGEEGCNSALADERLIHPGTKGVIKFRCRGEGFGDEKFLCRDEQ